MAWKTVDDGLDWLTDELRSRGMNREDLQREGGPDAGSLSNAYRHRRVGVDIAAQIAAGLNMPVEIVYREFGLLPEKQTVDDEEAQILAGLLNDIQDHNERRKAFTLAQMVLRQFAGGGKSTGAAARKAGKRGRNSAASG